MKNRSVRSGFLSFRCKTRIIFRLFLLVQPCIHDHAVGQQLYQPHLHPHGETVDGIVLAGLVQILQAGGNHIFGFPELIEVFHFTVAVGLEGTVEKFCFHPGGIHGHHADAFSFQLPVHGPGVAEDEGLGRTVGGDVGPRLEGRKAVQL